MTLQRLTGKVFAGNADLTDLGVFGSALSGTPTNPTGTNTEAQIQADAAYEEGWTEAVVTTKNFPPIEEVNGVLRTISYQTCYLLQEGIPVYDPNTVYSNTSVVKVINGQQLDFYISMADNQSGHTPQTDDGTYWKKAIITGDREIGVPQITMNFSMTLPTGYVDLVGQEESKTGPYSNLYAIYGDDYNNGTESSGNFRFPNFSNRAIYGGTSAGYIEAGFPAIAGTTEASGEHDHSRGDMNIEGAVQLYSQDVRVEAGQAFYNGTMSSGTGYALQTTTTTRSSRNAFKFDASRQWTGRTSKNGSHTHRISITSTQGGIIGNSDTVQPPAIKVRVFTRYK
jgi:hypothetical protein